MEVQFPSDGWYYVKPRQFFGKNELSERKSIFTMIFTKHFILMFTTDHFNDAKAYLQHRRNIAPAVYNDRRLTEGPIPSTSQEDDTDLSQEHGDLFYGSSETESELETVHGNNTVQSDRNASNSIEKNASGKVS